MGIFDKLMMQLIINKITSDGKKVRKRLDKLTASPMKAQEDFLMTLLRDNKDTEFGKKYDFASIHSIEEYRKRVPVSSFDDYSEAVYRMTEKCETNI
ncbi:MAG: GH3 auxin-responsive promoter family protein [Phocaeicola vulgatus]|nr:MAG: GH3 auxin-responsive promoter family protein [Phocaeicola vulgatus]